MHIHVSYTRTFILNYTTKTSIFDNEIYNHTRFIVLWTMCVPFPCDPFIEPLACWILMCVCVWRGGGGGQGGIFMLLFLMLFFLIQS